MFYVIRHRMQDVYVGISISSNGDAEFCNSTTVEFEVNQDKPHLFTDTTIIDKIFDGSYQCEWYNSSTDSPMITDYIRKEIMKYYEVVQLVVKEV